MGASDRTNQGKNAKTPKIPTVLCVDRPFSAVEPIGGRVCFEWSGVLRGATHYRHLLRVEHLRPISVLTEGLETIDAPYRIDESVTHQFWCWYQRRVRASVPPPLELLFRFQFDLGSDRVQAAQRLPHRTPAESKGRSFAIEQTYKRLDGCAAHIGGAIAARMQSLIDPPKDPHRLTLTRQEGINTDASWLAVIERAYLSCYTSKKPLSEDSVSGIILD